MSPHYRSLRSFEFLFEHCSNHAGSMELYFNDLTNDSRVWPWSWRASKPACFLVFMIWEFKTYSPRRDSSRNFEPSQWKKFKTWWHFSRWLLPRRGCCQEQNNRRPTGALVSGCYASSERNKVQKARGLCEMSRRLTTFMECLSLSSQQPMAQPNQKRRRKRWSQKSPTAAHLRFEQYPAFFCGAVLGFNFASFVHCCWRLAKWLALNVEFPRKQATTWRENMKQTKLAADRWWRKTQQAEKENAEGRYLHRGPQRRPWTRGRQWEVGAFTSDVQSNCLARNALLLIRSVPLSCFVRGLNFQMPNFQFLSWRAYLHFRCRCITLECYRVESSSIRALLASRSSSGWAPERWSKVGTWVWLVSQRLYFHKLLSTPVYVQMASIQKSIIEASQWFYQVHLDRFWCESKVQRGNAHSVWILKNLIEFSLCFSGMKVGGKRKIVVPPKQGFVSRIIFFSLSPKGRKMLLMSVVFWNWIACIPQIRNQESWTHSSQQHSDIWCRTEGSELNSSQSWHFFGNISLCG